MIEALTIASQATIRVALQVIDANHHGIVLVFNQAESAIGTATDRNIRRKGVGA